jgi:hypothetical protein
LPDTGTSRTIILQRLLDNAKIKYNTCGREPIVTANSSPLGCVGNVLLDIQIDRGKQLTIDALVAENLSSNCLIAWRDMQRVGIISPSFRVKVHLTKVAPAVINSRVNLGNPCAEPNTAITGANMSRLSIYPVLQPRMVKRTAVTASTAGQPNGPCVKQNLTKKANMARPSVTPVLQPRTVNRTTVTASTAGQTIGPCLKQNLTKDTLDSLLLEFKDVFEADQIVPLKGDPMPIH